MSFSQARIKLLFSLKKYDQEGFLIHVLSHLSVSFARQDGENHESKIFTNTKVHPTKIWSALFAATISQDFHELFLYLVRTWCTTWRVHA